MALRNSDGEIVSRARHYWSVLSGAGLLITGLVGLVGLADTITGHWPVTPGSPSSAPWRLPLLSVSWWLFLLAVTLLGAVLEKSYRLHRKQAEVLADSGKKIAAFMDNTPVIVGVRVADSTVPREFELLVDIMVKEQTAFTDDWVLKITYANGTQQIGLRGRINPHQCGIGRFTLTVTFPLADEIPRPLAAGGTTIHSLTGVDSRGRTFSWG